MLDLKEIDYFFEKYVTGSKESLDVLIFPEITKIGICTQTILPP